MTTPNNTAPIYKLRPNNTTTISPTSSTKVSALKVISGPIRSKELHLKKLAKLHVFSSAVSNETSFYFRRISMDRLMEQFGEYNPLYCRRPKAFPLMLLNLAAGNVSRTSGTMSIYSLMHVGLCFTVPPLPGRRRSSGRLTMTGVLLLEHWADRFKKFRPFLDAYMTKQARREIAATCFCFEMGTVPPMITGRLKEAAEYQNRINIKNAEVAKSVIISMARSSRTAMQGGTVVVGNRQNDTIYFSRDHAIHKWFIRYQSISFELTDEEIFNA